MPMSRANVIIEYSFSGMPENLVDGSLTIHEPPEPLAGIVRPPIDDEFADYATWDKTNLDYSQLKTNYKRLGE